MNWQKELDLALRAAKAAGERLREIAKGEKEILSAVGRDIKLQADRDSENIIIGMITAESAYPILAEESGEHGETASGPFWVIDPLDGTMNFSRGIPLCAVSIALVEGTEPLVGVIYDFNRDELFYAASGSGAFWGDGREMRVSSVTESKQAILTTGFPIRQDLNDSALQELVRQVQRFKKTRMIGTAALALAYVACGRMDAYWEQEIMLWDVAAGLVLLKEAGGHVTMTPSAKFKWARNVRCAASPTIWD